ncbi:MAG: aspartate aminotransferase family protein [Saprospirales bacterium]|nr:MAG: aspartate aminotransferase family protein [Saprospirales bacterium]
MVSWQRTLFKKYLAQTSGEPMMFEPVRAAGCWFFDASGKKYLDLISGISVNALGHGHPEIKSAIHDQIDRYMHTMVYGEFVISRQTELAEFIAGTLDDSLDNIYFVNSGSEAVEGAIKLAYKYTGRRGLIACKRAYHGSSTGALSLMDDLYYSSAYKPLLGGVGFIGFNREDDLHKITRETAAVFIEPVQGEAGYLPAEKKYLKALRDRCNETGCLLVLDEIQCGMGRTGKFWAHLDYDITPDILLTAKALGGGLPLGAFISSKEIMSVLSDNPILGHITTFGGNPVSCAASLACMELLTREGWIEKVPEKEALFRSELLKWGIEGVSGKGLMLGVPTGGFEQSKMLVQKCLQKGLITDWFLYETGKLRISPPLTIDEEEIRFACMVIGQSMEELSALK